MTIVCKKITKQRAYIFLVVSHSLFKFKNILSFRQKDGEFYQKNGLSAKFCPFMVSGTIFLKHIHYLMSINPLDYFLSFSNMINIK